MGFIVLPNGVPGGISRCVLSMFFMVPSESMAAARASYNPDAVRHPQLSGIVPLMVQGPRSISRKQLNLVSAAGGTQTYEQLHLLDCGWVPFAEGSFPFTVVGAEVETVSPTDLLEPSFIGVDCRGPRNLLNFNFAQGAGDNVPDITHVIDIVTSAVPYHEVIYINPGGFEMNRCGIPFGLTTLGLEYPLPDKTLVHTRNYESAMQLVGGHVNPESYSGLLNASMAGGAPDYEGYGTEIEPDVWHHLIMCPTFKKVSTEGFIFDAGTTTHGRVKESAKLYAALDDRNINGKALSYYMAEGGKNEWLTSFGYEVYKSGGELPGTAEPVDSQVGYWSVQVTAGTGIPTYDYTPPPIPWDNMHIPGDAGNVRRVEFGPTQIFTNVTMDPSILASRRIFITAEGKPAPRKLAVDFFGKEPEIRFYKRKSWLDASNEGTLGVQDSGAPDEEDVDIVVGTVRKFSPDPKVET